MSVNQDKNGYWFCQYRVPEKKSPIKEYFGKGENGKTQAKLRDLAVREAKLTIGEVSRYQMRLDELAQMYYTHKKRTKGPDDQLLRLINDDWLPLLCSKPIDRLGPADFQKLGDLYDHHSPCTFNRYLQYLMILINWGVKHKYIEENPMKIWFSDVKREEPTRQMLLDEEKTRKLYEVSPPHLQCVIKVMVNTGARPGKSELFSLKWEDLDCELNKLRIRGTKTKNSDRWVDISPDFCEELKEWRKKAKTPYVLEYRGKKLGSVKNALNNALERAELTKDIVLYHLRHLYASTLIRNGVDIGAVADLMGHTSARMLFKTYYHAFEDAKKAAALKVPKIA